MDKTVSESELLKWWSDRSEPSPFKNAHFEPQDDGSMRVTFTPHPPDPPVELPDEIQVANLKGCARCTLDHDDLTFTKMAIPIDDMPYWAPCPMKGEPILLRMTVESTVQVDPSPEIAE